MKARLIALSSLAAVVFAVPVMAQEMGSGGGSGDGPRDMRLRHHNMMDRADADDSGDISMEEFADFRIGELLKADADGNGELSVDEIQAAMEARRKQRMEEMFKRRYDIDGDGKITVAELKERQDKRFALLDANSDGQLSQDEFRKMREMFGWDRGGKGGGHHGRHHWQNR